MIRRKILATRDDVTPSRISIEVSAGALHDGRAYIGPKESVPVPNGHVSPAWLMIEVPCDEDWCDDGYQSFMYDLDPEALATLALAAVEALHEHRELERRAAWNHSSVRERALEEKIKALAATTNKRTKKGGK